MAAPPPVPATQPPTRSPASQAPASAAALRWLEGAFAGLRDELQSLRGYLHQQQATMTELVSGLTQQQAMLSELLDARDADLRLAEAAESLPQFVSDAVAHEARVNRERTVAAIASTLDAKLAEANLSEDLHGPSAKSTVAELRAFLENDPVTQSIVAAISTQAATQAMRTEVAKQLPKALNQALAGSDARMDELAERMDKLLTRAMRVGARAVAATAEEGRPGVPPKGGRITGGSRPGAKAVKSGVKAASGEDRVSGRSAPRPAKTPRLVKAAKTPAPEKAVRAEPKRSSRSTTSRPAKTSAPNTQAAKASTATTTAKAKATKTRSVSTKPSLAAKGSNGRVSRSPARPTGAKRG